MLDLEKTVVVQKLSTDNLETTKRNCCTPEDRILKLSITYLLLGDLSSVIELHEGIWDCEVIKVDSGPVFKFNAVKM